MSIAATFHGGYSYACPDITHVETFPSIRAARETFAARVNGRDSYYPGVDDSAVMDLYLGGVERGAIELPYPDIRLSVGPRGGIVATRC